MKFNVSRATLLATAIVLAVGGCSKKVKETSTSDSSTAAASTQGSLPHAGAYRPEDLDSVACLQRRVLYFDFDQDIIQPDAREMLECHAKYLRDRPGARAVLEGHADERGTREYNHALGERRGRAAWTALSVNGAPPDQINVVSYGEERPTCDGSAEDCWSRNRRVEIVYTSR